MATEEALRPAAEDTVTLTAKANPAGDKKATNLKKTKEKKSSKPRDRSTHPTYLEMIGEAITSLKERTGSSQYAIAKFIEDKHKARLSSNFSKLLLIQLRKFAASGKLTKVKNSYKLPVTTKKPAVTAPIKAKKAVTTKPKPKLAGATKPKVKTAVKPKPKSVLAAKTKKKVTLVAKPKAPVKVSKPKPKTLAVKPNSRPAKAAKTSSKDAPGKKVDVAKKAKKAKKTASAPKMAGASVKAAKKAKSGKSAVKVPMKKTLASKAK